MDSAPARQTVPQAVAAHRAGRLEDAERAYRDILAREPTNFEALRLLGTLYAQTRRTDLGLDAFRQALEVRPDWAEGHGNIGELLRLSGRLEPAATAFEAALRLTPRQSRAHYGLGLVRGAQNRHEEAASCFESAVAIDPDFADAWRNLGFAHQSQGQLEKAISAYRRAVRIAPGRLDTLTNLGSALHNTGRFSEAEATFRSALAVKDDHMPALRGLALAQHEQDDVEAIATIRRAIGLQPDAGHLHGLLGRFLRRSGRFDDAFGAFLDAVRAPKKDYAAFHGLSDCRKFRDEDKQIVAEMVATLRQDGLSQRDRSAIHFGLGKILDDLGRYEEAIRHFDNANRLWGAGLRFDRNSYSRALDTLIAEFDAEGIARLRAWGSSSERPILIVGMPRSGTTLVEQILASHAKVAGGGELSFWGRRMEELRIGSGGRIGQADAHSAIEDYLGVLEDVSPDAAHVTDKMPDNFVMLGPIHGLFPNARIVHCCRNPIDTCLSIYFMPFTQRHRYASDRGDIVFFYQEYRRLMAHWRRVIPADRLIEVDYERLIADQERVSRDIVAFCGLDWNEACLRFHETERPVRTGSDWQARQPIYKSSAERWRNYEPWLGDFRQLLGDGCG